ncbi:winged helix-turn-helix domain-containing protein [Peribacillus acanthi]|uniref:winged helix-turn-helix domain-containing protein n=1 Tax=Peribacillus acanthi TaxID=2171554 RepID=UPI000D3EA3F9|nr:winged helix-turn-helix domain-containing protein [Peribacillus acanthi]
MHIKVLDSIVYEVLLSLSLYKRQTHLKYLAISKNWYEETKHKISIGLHNEITEFEDLHFEDLSVHLIQHCPYKNFHGYHLWLSELPLGEMFELLAPYVSEKRGMPNDLDSRRKKHLLILSKWYQEYFMDIEETISPILTHNIKCVDLTALNEHPFSEIEAISKGFNIKNLQISEVVLVPTWHFRPLSLIDIFNEKAVISYPCFMDVRDETLLITKALAEDKRLQLLSRIKEESKTFTELVQIMGMTKGNIHHHLLLLRSAGLLRLTPTRQEYYLYNFRHCRIKDLSDLLLNL